MNGWAFISFSRLQTPVHVRWLRLSTRSFCPFVLALVHSTYLDTLPIIFRRQGYFWGNSFKFLKGWDHALDSVGPWSQKTSEERGEAQGYSTMFSRPHVQLETSATRRWWSWLHHTPRSNYYTSDQIRPIDFILRAVQTKTSLPFYLLVSTNQEHFYISPLAVGGPGVSRERQKGVSPKFLSKMWCLVRITRFPL